MGQATDTRRAALLCCDGPCCGPELSAALRQLEGELRLEVATCLSECEKAPVVRLRYDTDAGTRSTALLSGAEGTDVAAELRAWLVAGAPEGLTPGLRAARFEPGEGGGCLCDEVETTSPVTTAGEAPPG